LISYGSPDSRPKKKVFLKFLPFMIVIAIAFSGCIPAVIRAEPYKPYDKIYAIDLRDLFNSELSYSAETRFRVSGALAFDFGKGEVVPVENEIVGTSLSGKNWREFLEETRSMVGEAGMVVADLRCLYVEVKGPSSFSLDWKDVMERRFQGPKTERGMYAHAIELKGHGFYDHAIAEQLCLRAGGDPIETVAQEGESPPVSK
jgi:hypothetical protein